MKYCENCGAELEDSAVFCDECGARVETVPQEKAVDSEQSKEAEKQENAVIDTSDKPVEKRKRMIPILCGVIGVLIIAVIVIIIVTVTSRKSNNDENNAKNDLETAVTSETADETVKSTEATTQANNWKKQYIEYLKNVDSKNYGGCEYIDEIETLAIDRLLEIFGGEHANVQPHSGANANLAVYFAMLKPGDKVMGMNLSQGGHLTHGSPVNISGKYFNIVSYGVNEEGVIDYDNVREIALRERPKLIVAGASAYARTIDFKKFREIADEAGAYLMVDMAHIAGLVASGYHESPIPYAHVTTTTTHKTLRGPRGGMILSSEEFATEHKLNKAIFPGIQGGPLMHVIAAKALCFKEALDPSFKEYGKRIIDNAQALCKGLQKRGIDIVSGGTDNHLMLVDLAAKGLTGKEVEKWLDDANITANKNTIPNDPQSPFVTSGIRLGTAAVSSRGMNPDDMDQIAEAIAMLIDDHEANTEKAKAIVKELTDKYPLY